MFGFFQGASHMLRANGEIHVAHRNKAPFSQWNLEELASKCSLVLIQPRLALAMLSETFAKGPKIFEKNYLDISS